MLLVGLAILALLLLVAVALQSADMRIERSTTIAATPEVVFPQVNELRKWEAWSPWAKIDPGVKTTYEGPPAGNGAISTWSGNSQVGEGRMTIVESRPNARVKLQLDFIRPVRSNSTAEFILVPAENGTNVTWKMDGPRPLMTKFVGLFMDIDKLLGDQFDEGLAKLKAVCESSSQPQTEATAREGDKS
jgi:hypothetical protein